MTTLQNNFSRLAAIDVSKHVEKKSGLSYLSWAWAVSELFKVDPSANWEFHEPKSFGETMMVSCTVTAFGKPVTMHLPVMDHRNQAVKNPDSFVVNKNMMRCLVKAIACHGLGIYIYAGEDLPMDDGNEASKAPQKPQQAAEKTFDLMAALDWIGKGANVEQIKKRGRQAYAKATNDEERDCITTLVKELEKVAPASAQGNRA